MLKIVDVVLDDGSPGTSLVEFDEDGRPTKITLLTPAPEPQREQVRKVDEPIALSPAETARSFRLLRRHLPAARRTDPARARSSSGAPPHGVERIGGEI